MNFSKMMPLVYQISMSHPTCSCRRYRHWPINPIYLWIANQNGCAAQFGWAYQKCEKVHTKKRMTQYSFSLVSMLVASPRPMAHLRYFSLIYQTALKRHVHANFNSWNAFWKIAQPTQFVGLSLDGATLLGICQLGSGGRSWQKCQGDLICFKPQSAVVEYMYKNA